MADVKDRLVFLPSVKANRAKEGNRDKRIAIRNLQTPLELPSLELGSFDVHLVSSLFTHKQICKKVCEWFSAWRSWQQRILLCSVSDKCTKDQLRALVTTLEPVFHRDFTAMLKGRYPTSYIQTKRLVRSVPSADQLKNVLQPDQVDHRELNSSLLSKNFDDLEFSDLNHDYSGSGERNESSANDKDNKEEVSSNERSKTLGSRAFVRDSALMASEHTVQTAMDMIETQRHEHAPSFVRRVSTRHFFPKFQHQQLGFMKSALRTGDTDNLYGHAPVTFKYDKWWEGHKGSKLLKPRRSKLSNHFKSQIKQIHKWLDEWQIHERVELLSEVVKCCDAESLTFFAQCLAQRLRDITDLNCVPDHILLDIFTYLDVRSLCRSSQVCHRWRFLTSDSCLWKNKITTLGNSEGITGLTEKIEVLGKGQAVDWKQAYKEVRGYYKELAKVKLKEQQQELKKKLSEARLPKKKPRFSDKLPPPDIKSPEEEDKKTVISGVVEIPFSHVLEDIGPAQSPTTTDQRDHNDEFKATDLDDNDLTGGNLKMLAQSLQALSKDDKKPDELDLALDVRPTLVQASNLLREDEDIKKHKFRYLSLAVQGVFAILRVRRVQGHMDAILCLQFDKRRIITGSADRTVRVWDVRSGRSIHKLKGHKGGIRCLQFDDEKIVTGSWDMTVMVWHIVTFQRLNVLYGHSGCVSCLQFNDRFLATGSHDRTIRLWSTVTWKCEAVIEGHDGAVMGVELSEQFLVTASMDRTIKVWDLRSRNCMNTFFGHRDGILSVKVLGNLVLSGSADGMIMFWELATGACEVAIQAHEGPVFSLDYNDHQHIFSSGGDHLVKEWDLSTCTCLRSLQGHKGPVFCVKAVPHRIVSCSADGFTRIWDLDFPNKQGQTKTIPVEENSIQPTVIQQNPRKF